MVRLDMHFRAELRWPGTIEMGLGVVKFGRTSVTFDQVVFSKGVCVASARSVSVLLDEATRKPTALTDGYHGEIPALAAPRLRRKMMRIALAALIALVTAAPAAAADEFHREDLRIPMAAAGPRGLEAMLIRPAGTRRYPLALISHGSPRDAEAREGMAPDSLYAQAIEFARRGFAAVVVMRRGYGNSDGGYAENSGPCARRDYMIGAKRRPPICAPPSMR